MVAVFVSMSSLLALMCMYTFCNAFLSLGAPDSTISSGYGKAALDSHYVEMSNVGVVAAAAKSDDESKGGYSPTYLIDEAVKKDTWRGKAQ